VKFKADIWPRGGGDPWTFEYADGRVIQPKGKFGECLQMLVGGFDRPLDIWMELLMFGHVRITESDEEFKGRCFVYEGADSGRLR